LRQGSTTLIRYSLPAPEVVTLSIFDLLGREVKQLVFAFQPAGEHRIIFDGTGVGAGIYFYLLRAGTMSQKRKMLILP
jgi:hypothetical protein